MFEAGAPPANTVLVFYKVSCPTCKFALPFLHRIDREVIGISQNDAAATARFEQQYEVKFPSILDAEEDGFPLSNAYGIHHVPTLFVIDEQGKVAERIEGFDKDALERLGIEFSDAERVPEYKPG